MQSPANYSRPRGRPPRVRISLTRGNTDALDQDEELMGPSNNIEGSSFTDEVYGDENYVKEDRQSIRNKRKGRTTVSTEDSSLKSKVRVTAHKCSIACFMIVKAIFCMS